MSPLWTKHKPSWVPDEEVISDIITVSQEINPAFIAICGTPIPMITGVDFNALAKMCEARTGIPSFGFATDGMHSYLPGIAKPTKP